MGVVVFSLGNIWFALETSNEERSFFSSETLENPTLLKGAAVAFLFTIRRQNSASSTGCSIRST